MKADSGLEFWLRYVESAGGLTEDAGDTALVVLPAGVQARLMLPEEFAVTGDPDVAREDGAMFLAAGHPVLGQAADDVLAAGDVGRVAIRVPPAPPPEAAGLLERARDQFPVDHGKIDATEAPARGIRSMLRVGALVTYTASAEDHYQERAETFLDAVSRVELPASAAAQLLTLGRTTAGGAVNVGRLTMAIGQAHQLIEERARRREDSLARDLAKTFGAELERAREYYRDMLATIAKRQENAPQDRRELLAARAESVRQEEVRRLAEIREKFQPAHEIRPYRLQVYELPSWRFPVDIRRGDRRYPLVLEWLLPLSRFADVRCPHCDAARPLVAGKTRLGCTDCLAKPTVQLVPDPAVAARPVVSKPEPKKAPPTPPVARKPRAVRPQQPLPPKSLPPRSVPPKSLSPADVVKMGRKVNAKVWDAVVQRDRRISRLCAPDSPAAAAVKLYGPAGAAAAIGIPLTDTPVASTAATESDGDGLYATAGEVETAGACFFPFLLWWRMVDGVPLLDEITPYDRVLRPDRLPGYIFGPGAQALLDPPQPRMELDPVIKQLWRRCRRRHGLPTMLRSIAAWWRLADTSELTSKHPAVVLAAALDRAICQRTAQAGARYAEIAVDYGVEESAVRIVGAELQKQLGLSRTRLW